MIRNRSLSADLKYRATEIDLGINPLFKGGCGSGRSPVSKKSLKVSKKSL